MEVVGENKLNMEKDVLLDENKNFKRKISRKDLEEEKLGVM